MDKFGNLLWKIFSTTMVFIFNIGNHSAFAARTSTAANDPAIAEWCTTSQDDKKEETLCESGWYVDSCSNQQLGTRTLLGFEKNMSNGDTIYTGQYYEYFNDTANKENLRKFFAGTESIHYHGTDITNATYEADRKSILVNFCNKLNGNTVTCRRCPGNGSVPASTYTTYKVSGSSGTKRKIDCDKWRIYTIADCYMSDFSDNKGNFKYIATPENNTVAQRDPAKCFYTNTFNGSYLRYYAN